jgi:glucose/arabinose dehydrogenase
MNKNQGSRRALIALAVVVLIVVAAVFVLTQFAKDEGSGQSAYRFELVSDEFERPLYLTHAEDERLFVVEQRGRILIIENGELVGAPFLNIEELVRDTDNEQGLLSVAFDPDYAENGFFYVYYTGEEGDGDEFIARYEVSANNPNRANSSSARILLTINDPYGNHNGGQLQFGPDGYLYIGTGDGGAAADPHGNGQSLETLLGKLLRVDVSGNRYRVPEDNPFVDDDEAEPEIWAYGLRNPWRFSFDRETGDLYIADVGQATIEEINFQPAGDPGGQNYGWDRFEGENVFEGDEDTPREGFTFPVHSYDHPSLSQDLVETLANGARCSITGGYVYRGTALPELVGKYIYGDYCSGDVWALERDEDGDWHNELFVNTEYQISSFGEGLDGELYMMAFNNNVYRLVANED